MSADRIAFGRSVIRVRAGRVGMLVDARTAVLAAVAVLLGLLVTVLAVSGGEFEVSPVRSLEALFGGGDAFLRTVVLQWRLPRAVAALLFGAVLGLSGAIFQSLIRNPLGSPDVVGFDTGAYTGALVVMIVLGGTGLAVGAGALAGGALTTLLVYALAWKQGVTGFRLVIVGICLGAALSAFTAYLVMWAQLPLALAAAYWGAGSLNDVTWATVQHGLLWAAPAVLAVAALSRPLAMLELGDDDAGARGVRVEPSRLALMGTGVALSAMVVTLTGPIAFVALVAPQIGRRLARTGGTALVPAAAVGALLLATADLIARRAFAAEVPVGLVTVVLGGLYLVHLLAREGRR